MEEKNLEDQIIDIRFNIDSTCFTTANENGIGIFKTCPLNQYRKRSKKIL